MSLNKSKWKNVLYEIYILSPSTYCGDIITPFNSDKHMLARKLKISGLELMKIIQFLELSKLIERKIHIESESKYSELIISDKGFDVATRNEYSEKTLFFTKVLAVAASFQALWLLFIFLYSGQEFIFESSIQSVLLLIVTLIIVWILTKLIDFSIVAFQK